MDAKNLETEFHTKNEIEGQPDLWIKTLNSLSENNQIREFLIPLMKKQQLNIILTGAGSSAFVGQAVEHQFRKLPGANPRAVSTTSLVTHIKNYVDKSRPLLLISFARSGNSPESIAAVDNVESYCDEVYHLALTCNREGQLAEKIKGLSNGLTIHLPPESEDRGLAMTGSFTSMMLSAIYLSKITSTDDLESNVKKVAESTDDMISTYAPVLNEIASAEFNRIVFLGSGCLKAIARESHLKVQELSDGAVVGIFDSFLGFRHGPKAVVKDNTLLVFLFSPDKTVFRYEKDLVEELIQEDIAMDFLGVFSNPKQAGELNLKNSVIFNGSYESADADFDILPYVIPAQILGYYKSINLGLNPDEPSKNGSISRVVKGVTIYP